MCSLETAASKTARPRRPRNLWIGFNWSNVHAIAPAADLGVLPIAWSQCSTEEWYHEVHEEREGGEEE